MCRVMLRSACSCLLRNVQIETAVFDFHTEGLCARAALRPPVHRTTEKVELREMQRANNPSVFNETFRKRSIGVGTFVLERKIASALSNEHDVADALSRDLQQFSIG